MLRWVSGVSYSRHVTVDRVLVCRSRWWLGHLATIYRMMLIRNASNNAHTQGNEGHWFVALTRLCSLLEMDPARRKAGYIS